MNRNQRSSTSACQPAAPGCKADCPSHFQNVPNPHPPRPLSLRAQQRQACYTAQELQPPGPKPTHSPGGGGGAAEMAQGAPGALASPLPPGAPTWHNPGMRNPTQNPSPHPARVDSTRLCSGVAGSLKALGLETAGGQEGEATTRPRPTHSCTAQPGRATVSKANAADRSRSLRHREASGTTE